MSQSSQSSDQTIVYVDRVVYSTYSEAQKKACKKWYESNREKVCSKQREQYHAKMKSKRENQPVITPVNS